MTEELKTLNELIETQFSDIRRKKIRVDILREEAIKEIKFADISKNQTSVYGLFTHGKTIMFTEEVVNYIKWKNNITEEDLK